MIVCVCVMNVGVGVRQCTMYICVLSAINMPWEIPHGAIKKKKIIGFVKGLRIEEGTENC